ncbi:MAG: DUF2057 domain-containing protein [Colwellia sp.]
MFKYVANSLVFNIKPIKSRRLMSYLFALLLPITFISFKVTAITLTFSDNLVIRDLDGKTVEHGFFSTNQKLALTQGKHTLVLKYKDVFEDIDFNDERVVNSDYFVVKFTLEDQQTLFLTTSEISNLAAAERFAKAPELILLDENSKELRLNLETLSDYELAKQVTKAVSILTAPVVKSTSNTLTNSANKENKDFEQKVFNEVDAVPMLKYWWQKASKTQKTHFLQFINKNKS